MPAGRRQRITGTYRAGAVVSVSVRRGRGNAGLGVGEFDELVRRSSGAGATYVNVHTVGRPGGEIRAQLERGTNNDSTDAERSKRSGPSVNWLALVKTDQ